LNDDFMPERRILELRKKQRLREKRRKNASLTQKERVQIARLKEISRIRGDYCSERVLADVNKEHKKKFEEIAKMLAAKFPGQVIEALDEGTGRRFFYRDLSSESGLGENLRTTRTDIDKKHCEANGLVLASPEELVSKFGRNKFHLVVSTFGGANYTQVSPAKAVANIIEVLKPGGMASIVSQNNLDGGNQIDLASVRKVLKNYRNITVDEGRASGSYHRPGRILTIWKR